MTCKSCGRVVPDGATYCPHCGALQNSVNETTNSKMNDKERKEMEYIESKLAKGKLYGVVSIVSSILGLGSFGTLDIVAIIFGWLGLRHLKAVPNSYPEKQTAVTLNRAGIICSAGLIIAMVILIIVGLAVAPWLFASLAALI